MLRIIPVPCGIYDQHIRRPCNMNAPCKVTMRCLCFY